MIEKVFTRSGVKIKDQEAEEMIQNFEDIFGDEDKFAKFRLRQTMIKAGNGSNGNEAYTNGLCQAGMPEEAQYINKVKNSAYVVCPVQPPEKTN